MSVLNLAIRLEFSPPGEYGFWLVTDNIEVRLFEEERHEVSSFAQIGRVGER